MSWTKEAKPTASHTKEAKPYPTDNYIFQDGNNFVFQDGNNFVFTILLDIWSKVGKPA